MGSIHTLALPIRPNSRVLTAQVILQELGEEMFPGIEKAAVEYWEPGTATPDGRSAAAWEADGVLAIGVGDGWANPAALPQGEGAKESAATLVAKKLGVEHHPGLKWVLGWTTASDQGRSATELGRMLGVMYAKHDEKTAIVWFLVAMRALVQSHMDVAMIDRGAFLARSHLDSFFDRRGVPRRIISLQSDNETDSKYARHTDGGNADVVITEDPIGRVTIAVRGPMRNRLEVDVRWIVSAIRAEECRRAGVHAPRRTEDLQGDGVDADVPHWTYFKDKRRFVNTGAPTELSLSAIGQLVRAALELPASGAAAAAKPKRAVNGN